jgi:hypothetical protein
MGKSSRRKKMSRIFREEEALTKSQWRESIRKSKLNVDYENTPVIRKKWKVKNKYPKVVQTA